MLGMFDTLPEGRICPKNSSYEQLKVLKYYERIVKGKKPGNENCEYEELKDEGQLTIS